MPFSVSSEIPNDEINQVAAMVCFPGKVHPQVICAAAKFIKVEVKVAFGSCSLCCLVNKFS